MSDMQAALVEMNDSALTIDQLDALSRAVPDDQERKDIRLYLQVPCSCMTADSRGMRSLIFHPFIYPCMHCSFAHSFIHSFIHYNAKSSQGPLGTNTLES